MNRSIAWVIFSCCLAWCAGCQREASRVDVSGQVTFKGKSLPDGQILFIDQDGKGTVALPIADGAFTGKVKVGKVRVEIYGYRPGRPVPPGEPGAEGGPPKENYLPPKCNAESQLKEEIKDGQPNVFTYDLAG